MADNFYFLKDRWGKLYQHALNAEKNLQITPESSCVQLYCFIEILVGIIYRQTNLPQPDTDTLFNRLSAKQFQELVGQNIATTLHVIRSYGDKAIYGYPVPPEAALDLLKEAHQISQWFHCVMTGLNEPSTAFTTPLASPVGTAQALPLSASIHDLNLIKDTEILALQAIQRSGKFNDALGEKIKTNIKQQHSHFNVTASDWHHKIQLENAFTPYQLNQCQQDLIKLLKAFLTSNEENVFILRGYAGTGKTFMTKGLTEYFTSIGRNYMLTAPTGKAAKVLANKTRSQATTIHSAIYSFTDIKEYKEAEIDGSETYKYYADLKPNTQSVDTVYIIDEASMISDAYQESEFFRFGSGHLLKDLFQYINMDNNHHRKKIIFIGDAAQLPPVGMSISPALSEEYLSSTYHARITGFELKEVVRQKNDSGIIKNALMLRKSINDAVFNKLTFNVDYSDVHALHYDVFMDEYLKTCGSKINAETIVIAASNADVAAYNRRIREHFFPGASEIQAGDKIIMTVNSTQDGHFLSNGDFGMINLVHGPKEVRKISLKRKSPETNSIVQIPIELAFRNVEIGIRTAEGKPFFFRCKIIESLLESDYLTLSSDESKALYLDFRLRFPHLKPGSLEFKECLRSDPYFNALKIKYGYAITCHKAQGSEWRNVFVKCKTHHKQLSADYFRWLYTAITRTSAQLYLIDPPHIQLGSGLKPASFISPSLLTATGVQGIISSANEPGKLSTPHSDTLINNLQANSPPTTNINTEPNSFSLAPVTSQFGIPPEETFLNAILDNVQKLIHGTSFKVDKILHHQYQEAYFFVTNNKMIRINIGYNGRKQITYIQKKALTDSAILLEKTLSSLKVEITSDNPALHASLSIEQDFLKEFHTRLEALCDQNHVSIDTVTPKQWCQRYKFRKEHQIAVFDIWYNSKKQFTYFQPLISACTPGTLVAEIDVLLSKGLNE